MIRGPLGPDVVYRISRGGEVVTSHLGWKVKLLCHLDFVAVAEHAENLVLADRGPRQVAKCRPPGPAETRLQALPFVRRVTGGVLTYVPFSPRENRNGQAPGDKGGGGTAARTPPRTSGPSDGSSRSMK